MKNWNSEELFCDKRDKEYFELSPNNCQFFDMFGKRKRKC